MKLWSSAFIRPRKIVLLTVLALSLLFAAILLLDTHLYAVLQPATRPPVQEPIVYQDVNFDTPIAALKKYRILGAWTDTIPPRPYLVALGPDGSLFEMPEELENIFLRERMSITAPELAVDVAAAYATLSIGYGNVIVLSSLDTIPGVEKNPPKKPITKTVSAPQVMSFEGTFTVHFFTWKELGGVLEEWLITISENGTIMSESEPLATWVGAAIGLG
jgi:hypothetical protein